MLSFNDAQRLAIQLTERLFYDGESTVFNPLKPEYMSAFDQQEAWEMKPRKLTIDEIEDPETVVTELFQYASLPQFRWYLWEGTKTMITGSFNHLRIRERCNLIYFYEQIERLIEVTHVMHERYKLYK